MKIIIVFFLAIITLHSQEPNVFFSIPDRATSSSRDFFPLWFTNPLNLKHSKQLKASFLVSPSKYLLPELNSLGSNFSFPLADGLNCGLFLEYLGSKKFSYSNFKVAFQKNIFQQFNIATRISTKMLSIDNFGKKAKFSWDAFLEYVAFQNLTLSFSYKNLLSINDFENQIATFGVQSEILNGYSVGAEVRYFLKMYTSYNFFIYFEPFENIYFDFDVKTNPQVVTFGFGYKLSDIVVSLFLQYHSYLLFSNTIGVVLKF
ncbi:hypothetical protein D9V84_00190 [Bacteroidetes/Chlorobi group bacterium Naka2016]|jgi:hypothetical protein|nr:MAG: hypothetical protein D9V84_00190 [Bacteroidetes/Chlorobi group bacterium Naka2016]